MKNKKIKEKIDRAFNKTRNYKAKLQKSKPTEIDIELSLRVITIFSIGLRSERSLWIVDSGANKHVYNDTIKHRFIKEIDIQKDIIVGTRFDRIKAYGRIIINVIIAKGKKDRVIITNVAYIPDFQTNLLSSSKLSKINIDFKPKLFLLIEKNKPYLRFKEVNGLYLIKNNIDNTEYTDINNNVVAAFT